MQRYGPCHDDGDDSELPGEVAQCVGHRRNIVLYAESQTEILSTLRILAFVLKFSRKVLPEKVIEIMRTTKRWSGEEGVKEEKKSVSDCEIQISF